MNILIFLIITLFILSCVGKERISIRNKGNHAETVHHGRNEEGKSATSSSSSTSSSLRTKEKLRKRKREKQSALKEPAPSSSSSLSEDEEENKIDKNVNIITELDPLTKPTTLLEQTEEEKQLSKGGFRLVRTNNNKRNNKNHDNNNNNNNNNKNNNKNNKKTKHLKPPRNQYLFNGLNIDFYLPEDYQTLIPTYYVDPYILYLTNQRFEQCSITSTVNYVSYSFKDIIGLQITDHGKRFIFSEEYFLTAGKKLFTPKNNNNNNKGGAVGGGISNYPIFAIKELQLLYEKNANEYYRGGHELLGYHYFIEYLSNNPHYQSNYFQAEMEYLPVLPLHWRAIALEQCNYTTFIQYLFSIQLYLEQRDTYVMNSLQQKELRGDSSLLRQGRSSLYLATKFVIASTYNMRTMWGYGMPSTARKGFTYQTITSFVTNISVGHYERWPQCPDVLRKWWKYVVELPYLPMVGRLYQFEEILQQEGSNIEQLGGEPFTTISGGGRNNFNVETMNLFNPINTFSKYQGLLKQREEHVLQAINQGLTGQQHRFNTNHQKQRRRSLQSITTDDGKVEYHNNFLNAPNEEVLQALHGGEEGDITNNSNNNSNSNNNNNNINPPANTGNSNAENRRFTFLFMGNLEMVGPNKVCSVRSVLQSLLPRADLLMIHIPLTSPMPGNELIDEEEILKSQQYWQFPPNVIDPTFVSSSTTAGPYPVYPQFVNYIEQSIFCIITASHSYSTAFFYHAIANDCIPIVINDWFVFSFPWIIAYESFVIRILEADFLRSPNEVLDSIKEQYLPLDHYEFTRQQEENGKTNPANPGGRQGGGVGGGGEFVQSPYYLLFNNMRKAMFKMKLFLTYETITYQSNRYYKLLFSDIHYYYHFHYHPKILHRNSKNTVEEEGEEEERGGGRGDNTIPMKNPKIQTMIPLELFLLELRYAQHPYKYYNNIPCSRPMLCSHKYSKHYYFTKPLTNTTTTTTATTTMTTTTALATTNTRDERGDKKKKGGNTAGGGGGVEGEGEGYSYQNYLSKNLLQPHHPSKSRKANQITLKSFNNQILEKLIQSRYSLLFSKSVIFSPSSSSSSTDSALTNEETIAMSYSYNLTLSGNTSSSGGSSSSSPLFAVIVQNDAYQVHALYFESLSSSSNNNNPKNTKGDYRPYLCKHNPRLIGQYKIVYFMQCIRVLWTLNPGKFKPQDLTLLQPYQQQQPPATEATIPAMIIENNPYHLTVPSSTGRNAQRQQQQQIEEVKGTNGLTIYERDYILAFHNLSRPIGWKAVNYPRNKDLRHVLTYQQIVGLGDWV